MKKAQMILYFTILFTWVGLFMSLLIPMDRDYIFYAALITLALAVICLILEI